MQKCPRFEHSNFFKVNVANPNGTTSEGHPGSLQGLKSLARQRSNKYNLAADPTTQRTTKSNYELFNCSNFNIRYWSWNYRGCWHQTCPPIVTR